MKAYARRGQDERARAALAHGAGQATHTAAPHAAGPASVAPLQALFDRSRLVNAHGALRAALDRSPRVAAGMRGGVALGERAVQRHAAHARTQVLQAALTKGARRTLHGTLIAGGAAAGAYYGSTFGPWGALAGGLLGGAAGYFAPGALRRLRSGRLWDEVNRDQRGYRTWNTPQDLADQLARSSPEFRNLRGRADLAVRGAYGRDLAYSGDSDKTGGHSAVYGGGSVYVDEESNHPAITVQNLVFETANAAQTAFFNTLRDDYADGSMADKDLEHYAALLQRDAGELGALRGEYAQAGLEARRSLLQEWGEWNSLELARSTFERIAPRFTSDTAQDQWQMGFGPRLAARSFGEYYKFFGEDHRQAVQHALERVSAKDKKKV